MMSKLQDGQIEDPNMMVEEISIFQNKITTEYPQKVLEKVRSKVGANDQNFGESGMREMSSTAPGDAMWRGDHGPTAATFANDGSYNQTEYVKKLEQSVSWLEEKLQRARNDYKNLKKENANLKDSNENHIFINEKLNKALKKSEDRIEKLTSKIKTITNESVVIPKKQLPANTTAADVQRRLTAEPNADQMPAMGFGGGGAAGEDFDGDDIFGGDVSSIMIKPDQILHDRNVADE